MLTDFAEIWWHVCNLTSQFWHRISLKSDVVCQSYGNVYRGSVFSWTRCICFFCLIWSMASILFYPHAWQSFSRISVQVFLGLPLGLALSTSYSIHFFIQSLSSFRNTCPYHHNLFCCGMRLCHLILVSLSLNPLLGILSITRVWHWIAYYVLMCR